MCFCRKGKIMDRITGLIFGGGIYMLLEAYVFFSLFTPRYSKKLTVFLYALKMALSAVKHYFLFENMVLRTPLEWVVSLVFLALLFKEPFWKKFCTYVGMVAIVGITESVIAFVFTSIINGDYYQTHDFLGNGLLLVYSVLLPIFFLAYVQFLKRKSDTLEKKSSRFIVMYGLIQLLLLFIIYAILWDYRLNATPIMLLFLAVIGVSVGFGIALVKLVKASAAETARAEQIEAQMKLSDEHFKRLQLQYEQYRKLRHDYYNHISTIKGIKDEAERDAYIDDLTKQIENHRGITFCSNAAVDALLFNEKAQADKVGVKIEFKIADLDSLTISSIDLCTILSNLIDNAIRGASEVDGEDKRFVSVSVFPRAGQLIVNVRNGSLPPKEDFSTTKKYAKDGEHGLGLTIVREVAERHGGAAVYSFSDGVFEASVSVAG